MNVSVVDGRPRRRALPRGGAREPAGADVRAARGRCSSTAARTTPLARSPRVTARACSSRRATRSPTPTTPASARRAATPSPSSPTTTSGSRASSSSSSRRSRAPMPASAMPEFFLDGEPPPGFRPELLDGPRPVRVMEALARRGGHLFDAVGLACGRTSPRRRRLVRTRAGRRPRGRGGARRCYLRKRVHAGSTAHNSAEGTRRARAAAARLGPGGRRRA